MSFSAGGANTSGVMQIEGGLLKTQTLNTAVTSTGTFINNLVVPAGKKWILKCIKSFRGSGTYTITTVEVRISPGTNNTTIASGTTVINPTLIPTSLVIPAGGYIQLYVNCPTTFSSAGEEVLQCLYQEIDA